ncbi:MAG: T9SS type A sorting domain-containing protein [Chitinophagales bacterium]
MKNIITYVVLAFIPVFIFAQAGTLDTVFGTGGKVITDLGANEAAEALVIQPDGKIIAAGQIINIAGDEDFALVRYNSDGTADNTFGLGGEVITDFGGNYDAIQSIALQIDGKIVVAGYTNLAGGLDFALARYNSDGNLDNSFSGDGKVNTYFTGTDGSAHCVVIQPDGKIVAVGAVHIAATATDEFAMARYNSDGSLDNTFDFDGKVTTNFGACCSDQAFTVKLQSDDKIVVAGFSYVTSSFDFAIVRYNPDGSIDNTFGVGGFVTTDFDISGDEGFSLAIQPDNKILLVGASGDWADENFAFARYDTDGMLDNTFGIGGKLSTSFGINTYDDAVSVIIQPDGKIALSGWSYNDTYYDFALARYNSDGTPDNTFGIGGKVLTDFGGTYDSGNAAALQADGKIVVSGETTNLINKNFALARYNVSGCNTMSILPAAACNSYTVPSGDETYFTSGTYYDTLTNFAGCDSILIINLNLTITDISVVQYGNTLTANIAGVIYQWMDCSTGAILPGETNQSCTAIVSGSYAVIITNAPCIDTSSCYNIFISGAEMNTYDNTITISPNPFTNEILISNCSLSGEIILFDFTGKEILHVNSFSHQAKLNTENILPGIYLIQYFDNKNTETQKIVKY